jgi:hypothetical protein
MATEILRPNAAGDETNIQAQDPSSGDHYDKVDEETPDEDSTRVRSGTIAWQRDLYNLADSSGGGTINSVTVYARCNAAVEPNQTSLIIAIKTHSTVYEGDEETLTTSYANYSKQWTQNPYTSSAWTWDEIDDLQAGISLRRPDSSQTPAARCTQVYVEVDYTPSATSKTSSDTGSGVEAIAIPGAVLADVESGSGFEAFITRLLTAAEAGYGTEASEIGGGGLLKHLFAGELGEGADGLTAKIEIPTKGGGMRLWI